MVDKVDKIWLDGKLIPWEQANVHVLTHTLHYGLGVFEGIRCYKLGDGRSAVFRLEEHIRRLFDSAHICMLPMPYQRRRNRRGVPRDGSSQRARRMLPAADRLHGRRRDGARRQDQPDPRGGHRMALGCVPRRGGSRRGIRAKVSSFQRAGVNTLMSKGKINGHYVNSILAKREVQSIGYDEAIMLDTQGYVSEASGENIFVVRDGEVATPPMGVSILGGITRNSVMRVMQGLGSRSTNA